MAEPGGVFDPNAMLRALDQHGVEFILIGGLAATLYGSPHVTTDVDITPAKNPKNLRALAAALDELDARLRVEGQTEGVPFDRSAAFLSNVEILNLVTRHGALDIAFVPSGTGGHADLKRAAREIEVDGTHVVVAALSDIIRSKEAAGRERDRVVLPSLRRLLDRLDD
jgi:hypothetical protein